MAPATAHESTSHRLVLQLVLLNSSTAVQQYSSTAVQQYTPETCYVNPHLLSLWKLQSHCRPATQLTAGQLGLCSHPVMQAPSEISTRV
jgi:hypothetical protein